MKVLLVLLTLLLSPAALLSQSNKAPVRPTATSESDADSTTATLAQFNALAQLWKNAYNANDTGKLTTMYAVEADYISGHVQGLVAHGRERLIANFKNGIMAGGHIDSVTVLSVQMSCDLATLLCKYEATNAGHKAVGRNLLVVKKAEERWIIVLHMTVI